MGPQKHQNHHTAGAARSDLENKAIRGCSARAQHNMIKTTSSVRVHNKYYTGAISTKSRRNQDEINASSYSILNLQLTTDTLTDM